MPCPRCGTSVAFLAEDVRRRCRGCGRPVSNLGARAERAGQTEAPWPRSVRILREEHQIVEKALGGLDRAARAILEGELVDEAVFRKTFDFLEAFLHGVHEIKEKQLCRRVAERGFSGPGASLNIVSEEHRDSQAFLSALLRILPEAVRGDPAARRMLAENALAYVGFLRSHSDREEADLFAAAGRYLSEEDDRELAARSAQQGGHWRQLADEIEGGK